MANLTIELPTPTEQRLQKKAREHCQSAKAYVERLVENDVQSPVTPGIQNLSAAEFQEKLDALSAGLPPLPLLPADFSRADLYGEHD